MARAITAAVGGNAGGNEQLYVSLHELDEGSDEDQAGLLNYSIEESGDVYLARLILAQTALDAQKKSDDYVRQCARAYLTNVHDDLAFICEMGRVNVGYLVRTWRRILGGVTKFPQGYKTLYKRDKKWQKKSSELVSM